LEEPKIQQQTLTPGDCSYDHSKIQKELEVFKKELKKPHVPRSGIETPTVRISSLQPPKIVSKSIPVKVIKPAFEQLKLKTYRNN
jgi:hypothetical protein